MKNKIVFLLMLLPASLWAQTVKYTFKAHIGTASGAPAIVYLIRIEGGIVTTDSITPVNGQFSFAGTLSHPAKATLMIKHWKSENHPTSYSDKIPVYLENGVITMQSADSLKNATFTGSPLNIDNQALLAANWKVENDANAIMARFYKMPAEQRKSPEVAKEMEEAQKSIAQQQKQVLRSFIASHPASYVSFVAMKALVGAVPNYDEAIKVFNSLSPALRNTPEGKAYAAQLASIKATSIGATAPDFVQNDVNGNPVKLSSFRGKYVLVDFWASWCSPCRQEIPNLLSQYKMYKDKGFEILSVSLDNSRDKWLKALQQEGMTWPQVSDLNGNNNSVARLYGVSAIPATFLVDRDGKLISTNLRGEDLNHKLAELFN